MKKVSSIFFMILAVAGPYYARQAALDGYLEYALVIVYLGGVSLVLGLEGFASAQRR